MDSDQRFTIERLNHSETGLKSESNQILNSTNFELENSQIFEGEEMWDTLEMPEEEDMNFMTIVDGASSLISDDVFDIRDFTTASGLERLVRTMELVLKKWTPILTETPSQENIILSDFFQHETKFKYKLTAFKSSSSISDSCSSNALTSKLLSKTCPSYYCIRDPCAFPVRSHRLVRYFGVSSFLLLEIMRPLSVGASVYQPVTIEESSARTALSALVMAARSCKLLPTFPCFVLKSSDPHPEYLGKHISQPSSSLAHPTSSPSITSTFSTDAYEDVSPQRGTLSGLLEYFQSQTGSIGDPIDTLSTSVSVRISFRVSSPFNPPVPCIHPLGDPIMESPNPALRRFSSSTIMQLSEENDAIETMYLHTRWPSFRAGMMIDSHGFSELQPSTAPIWELRIIPSAGVSPYANRLRSLLRLLDKDRSISKTPLVDIAHSSQFGNDGMHLYQASTPSAVSSSINDLNATSHSKPSSTSGGGMFSSIARSIKSSLETLGLPSNEALTQVVRAIQDLSTCPAIPKTLPEHSPDRAVNPRKNLVSARSRMISLLPTMSFPVSSPVLPAIAQVASQMTSLKALAMLWDALLNHLRLLWDEADLADFLGDIPIGPANLPRAHQNFIQQKLISLHAALQARRQSFARTTPEESMSALASLPPIIPSSWSQMIANVREPIVPIYPPTTSDVSVLHAEKHLKLASVSVEHYLTATHQSVRNEMISFLRANPKSAFNLYAAWRQCRFQTAGIPCSPPPEVQNDESVANLPLPADVEHLAPWFSLSLDAVSQKLIFHDWQYANDRILASKQRPTGENAVLSAPCSDQQANFMADSEGEFALASLESANAREVLESLIGALACQYVVRLCLHPFSDQIAVLNGLCHELLDVIASLDWGVTDEKGAVSSIFKGDEVEVESVKRLIELIEESERCLLLCQSLMSRLPHLQHFLHNEKKEETHNHTEEQPKKTSKSSSILNEDHLLSSHSHDCLISRLISKEVVPISSPLLKKQVCQILFSSSSLPNHYSLNTFPSSFKNEKDAKVTSLHLPSEPFMKEFVIETLPPVGKSAPEGVQRLRDTPQRLYACIQDSSLKTALISTKFTFGK